MSVIAHVDHGKLATGSSDLVRSWRVRGIEMYCFWRGTRNGLGAAGFFVAGGFMYILEGGIECLWGCSSTGACATLSYVPCRRCPFFSDMFSLS
jgi:hypothetical protein